MKKKEKEEIRIGEGSEEYIGDSSWSVHASKFHLWPVRIWRSGAGSWVSGHLAGAGGQERR